MSTINMLKVSTGLVGILAIGLSTVSAVCPLVSYPASDVTPGDNLGPTYRHVPTALACLKLCDHKDACNSAVYVPDRMTCYLKEAGAEERVDAIERFVVVACEPPMPPPVPAPMTPPVPAPMTPPVPAPMTPPVPAPMTPPVPAPMPSTTIGECENFITFAGFDVDAGESRTITFGVTLEECATICKKDINCGSSVLTSSGACYTKDGNVEDRVGDGDLTNLTLISCTDPVVGPAGECSEPARYPGYDVTPGTFITPVIENVVFEYQCLDECLANPLCMSAVHVSTAQTCYLKEAAATPLVGDGDLSKFVLLECTA